MKKNIILIIGQNKNKNFFKNSIDIYLSNNNIHKIVIVTWDSTPININTNNSKINIIKTENVKCSSSIMYQKYLYDIGIKYINYVFGENMYVLKTRFDVLISNEQLEYIFNQKYIIENSKIPEIQYKIWIAWTHLTKPFYIEDSCFYSHVSVMKELCCDINDNLNIFCQGKAHIGWFLKIAKLNNIYIDNYEKYNKIQGKFNLDDDMKELLTKYKNVINNFFIIKTLKNGIQFRVYNNINFYKINNYNIYNIINNQAKLNLKIVYNNEDFIKILDTL